MQGSASERLTCDTHLPLFDRSSHSTSGADLLLLLLCLVARLGSFQSSHVRGIHVSIYIRRSRRGSTGRCVTMGHRASGVVFLERDIILLDVNDGLAQEGVGFSDDGGCDLILLSVACPPRHYSSRNEGRETQIHTEKTPTHIVLAIRPRDSFRQTDHAFQLPDCDPKVALSWSTFVLSERSVLVDQHR